MNTEYTHRDTNTSAAPVAIDVCVKDICIYNELGILGQRNSVLLNFEFIAYITVVLYMDIITEHSHIDKFYVGQHQYNVC